MKKAIILLLIAGTFNLKCSSDLHPKAQLESRIEQLKEAMIVPDKEKFHELVSDSLSYGHSNGDVENKKQFISSLISGKSNFLTIKLSDQIIKIVDDIAIVRHDLFATTHDKSKPLSNIKLKVLLIWQFKNGKWILLARQATK